MASSRNSKSKSSGLRILWIPGKRKSHPKGRFESTNKQVNYSTPQKKNQLWSLGGNKTHKNLIEADPDTSLFDGPSVSGLTPLAACTITATAAGTATAKLCDSAAENHVQITDAPPTPNSSSSTALLVSIPNSPEPTVTVTSTNEAIEMPAAKYSSPPVTTAVVEITDERNSNRFAILNQNGIDDIDVYDLPTPPKNDPNWRDNMRLNTSGDTTSSIATIVSSSSPNSEVKSNANSNTNSPTKKKSPRSHNNNQGDVNSIESVSDNDQMPKLDLDWIDDLVLEHNANEMLRKSNKHKKKKQHTTAKELDQLDGIPSNKSKTTKSEPAKLVEDDDKLVKCLYFTLMCCECSIS